MPAYNVTLNKGDLEKARMQRKEIKKINYNA
jgi:hypothetical protein